MTQPQAVLAAIVAAMLVLMAWRRWRHDVVAVVALLAATVAGAVPADRMLDGFASPAVATLAALLILAAAVRHSAVLEVPVRLLAPWLGRLGVQVAVLGTLGAATAAVLGDRGAAVVVAPAPAQVLRRAGFWPSSAAAPVAYALTLGGLASGLGTLPNLLASEIRRGGTGAGFALTDFAAVGGVLAVAGLAFLAVAWRLLPRPSVQAPPALAPAGAYASEVHVPAGSPAVGRRLAELEHRGDGALGITAVLREGYRRLDPRPGLVVEADDTLVLLCGLSTLQRMVGRLGLRIAGDDGTADPDRVGVVEAVVTPGSRLVGRSCAEGMAGGRLSLLGVGRSAGQPAVRLHRVKLQAGDVLVLQGELAAMPPLLADLGFLPLAEQRLRLGRRQRAAVPAAVALAAAGLAAWGAVPAVVALLGAVAVLLLLRHLGLNEMYASVDWPLLVLAGALLPIGAALSDSGLAAAAAGGLVALVGGIAPAAAVALVLAAALALAALVNGVAAVLVLAPAAVALAGRLGAGADPFLMAAAVGASCNFLSGALALALPEAQGWGRPAGAWRVGLPLTLLVFAVGLPMILLVWPVRP